MGEESKRIGGKQKSWFRKRKWMRSDGGRIACGVNFYKTFSPFC